jgi:hypothetical protein
MYYCNKSSCGVGTAHPSGAPEFTPGICGVRVDRFLFFYVMFCRSLFVPLSFFFLYIPLFLLLRITASDYPFGIFWPFHCFSFLDLRLLITPLESFGHSIVSPS